MKNCWTFLFLLTLSPLLGSAQAPRYEVFKTLSGIYEITENSSLIIRCSNLNTSGSLIKKGLMPLELSTYRFKSEGDNAKLYTSESTYYSYDRSQISMYSNEKNPTRQDFQTYLFSQVRTVTYGPVLKDAKGFYYTTEVSFNLE
jgi:hypothetical protein